MKSKYGSVFSVTWPVWLISLMTEECCPGITRKAAFYLKDVVGGLLGVEERGYLWGKGLLSAGKGVPFQLFFFQVCYDQSREASGARPHCQGSA